MAGYERRAAARHFLAVAVVALGVLGPTASARSADAQRGNELAKRWCASCHIINSKGDGTAADRAPTFPRLANDRTKSASYLRGFLTVPHYPMPNLDLGRREIDDLVAYIETLKKK
jgi:mono/diheme cytochrome c family protein